MTVVPLGYYGMKNFGDDLFYRIVEDHQRLIWPDQRINFVAPRPGSETAWARAYKAPGLVGSSTRVAAMASHLGYRHFAYCGGSVLQDVRGTRNLLRQMAVAGIGKFEALGVSVGPFRDDHKRARVAQFLRRFDRIIVRDASSLEELRAMDLPGVQGGDLAGLLPEFSPRQRGQDSYVVAPCSADGAYTEEYERGVLVALDALDVESHDPILIASLNSNKNVGDIAVALRLRQALRAKGLRASVVDYQDVGLAGLADLLGSARAVISTRLHAAVVAYMYERPIIMVNYQAKCAEFASDVGLSEELLVQPSSAPTSWRRAAHAITSEPSVPASMYRSRARSAYFARKRSI